MDRLLIEVYVPAISKLYDIFIPHGAKVHELTILISDAIEKLSDGLFITNDAVLCDGNDGTILNINLSVEDMKLYNGSRLMLI